MHVAGEQFDLAIIGAGPAGISAADAAAREDLSYVVVEKNLLAETIYRYPVGRTVFSTIDELEMTTGALRPAREKPTREELLSHYVRFVLERDLRIQTEEEALRIERADEENFIVHTSRDQYRTRSVLVAVGAMARPRRLGVTGEDLPKVYHRFIEPYPFVRKETMVVGGGNSAAEAALFLAEDGSRATLAILRADWENHDPKRGAIKSWVRAPLEEQIALGRLRVVLLDHVQEITEREVILVQDNGERARLLNDAVFVLIGSLPDLSLLRDAGVEIKREGDAEMPVYNRETFETNVSGLYVAGHFTHARHIKEAIAVPRRIVPMIAERVRAAV